VRALATALLYFGTFVALGAALRWWLGRKVDLDDRPIHTGSRRMFFLGSWRSED
jgi:hypothetical protein